MRLGSLTISVTLSAALLSGCSFITGPAQKYENPYAKHQAAQYGQYSQAGSHHCQIASPRQPIPRGCRPEQVTIGVKPQGPSYAAGGFPQQPQFGQPQYANGSYGAAVGQTASLAHHTAKPQKRKPRLRGSLSLGAEKSMDGNLINYGVRDDLDLIAGYNPQTYNEGTVEGSQATGLITQTTYTANDLDAADIFAPNSFESSDAPAISFQDAWSTPLSVRGGIEYILNDKMTVFANGGYAYAAGNDLDAGTVDATLYRRTESQSYTALLDGAGDPIPGSFIADGPASVSVSFIPNETIASFAYEFSDLERYDLEVGARHYFSPLVKSEGYKTVTPFIGASVGASHVNAVDVTVSQRQAFYERAFEGTAGDATYSVPTPDNTTRLYDAQWLPQGQVNVGAEWQVTPGFALAAETGLKVQGAREYADFTNAAGDTVSGGKGDTNISIPLTLRGSVNF